jgi:hypothetical protein
MFLGGTIKMRAPDFEKKEITVESDVSAEFYLNTEKGTKSVIDNFDLFIELDGDKEVVMSTNIEQDDIFPNAIFINIENEKGDGIGLSLSIDQVNGLSKILDRFKEGFYAVKALAIQRSVVTEVKA